MNKPHTSQEPDTQEPDRCEPSGPAHCSCWSRSKRYCCHCDRAHPDYYDTGASVLRDPDWAPHKRAR